MSESAVVERPAGAETGELDDLALSPAERAEEIRREGLTAEERIAEDELREQLEVMTVEEIADAAAEKEQALGGSDEAVEYARSQALKSAEAVAGSMADAAAAQAAPDESPSKTKELQENAGEAVGEMPPGEPEDVMVPPDTLMVSGTAKGSHRKWNGKAPTETFLNLKGVKIEVPEGEFKKGERIRFSGEMVVVSEGAKDKLDKDTKQVVDSKQLHDAIVIDFELED